MDFQKRIKGIVFGSWGRIYGSLRPVRPVPTIETLLDKANGRRRVRTLDREDVEELIAKCRNQPDGHWASISGGRAHFIRWASRSTFAFAARIDGRTYIGITEMNGITKGPGSGWIDLYNLSVSGEQKRVVKLRNWRDRNLNKTVVWVKPE